MAQSPPARGCFVHFLHGEHLYFTTLAVAPVSLLRPARGKRTDIHFFSSSSKMGCNKHDLKGTYKKNNFSN